MYPVSANFHTLAIQDAPKTRVRIYFIGDGVDCTDDNDVQTNGTLLKWAAGDTDSNGRIGQNGVVFNELFNPDKNIQIGRAVSSQIGMTLLNTDGALDNFQYGRCKVYLDVYDSANSAWLTCPMGVYIIELPTKRKVQLINAVGFDQMTKLDAICDTWWNGLNWSGGLTLLQIVNSMATQLGVSVSSNTASEIVNSSLSYTAAPFDCVEVTYREVLEVIAEATGTVARFDRNGALDLRYFYFPQISGDDITINTDTVGNQCLSIDIAEYTVAPIDLLRAKFAEGDIGVTLGSGTNEYVIQNNLFLNGANTTEITNKLSPLQNRLFYAFTNNTPMTGRFIWDWSIEAGDIFYLVRDGKYYAHALFQQTMTWRGGYVVSDLICDGDKTRPVLDSATRDYYRLDSDMRTLVIEAPRINLLGYTTINNGFRVNLDGTFEANGATINGAFTSSDTVGGVPFSMQMAGASFSIMNNAHPMFSVQPKADGSFSGRVDMADNNGNVITVDGAGVSVASQISGGLAQTIALIVQGTDPDNRGVLNLFGVKNNRNVSIRLDPTGGSTFGNSFSNSDVTVYGNVSATGDSSVGGDLSVTGGLTVGGLDVIPFLTKGTAIPSNANMNTYTTPGVYYATTAVASTLTNANITTVAFKLIVMPMTGSDVMQIHMADWENCIIAMRRYNGSTWSGYRRIAPVAV